MKLNRNEALQLGLTEEARVLANAFFAAYHAGTLRAVRARMQIQATCYEFDEDGDIASFILDFIDEMMPNSYGTEVVRANSWDNYWGDTVAIHINTGDSYTATIIYEVERDEFLFATLGDWVERRGEKLGVI